ncbi:MAG: DUF4349 domain-containing protein [Taibaiella sp.]|nr:DUF4349 domain-containing protein [Taibaiella sp.]
MHSSKLLWLLPLVFLCACEAGVSEPETRYQPASASNVPEIIQQSTTQDSMREKVIRTADISCHVEDVVTASANIEHAVAAMGGHVEDSRMNNNVVSDKTVPYKPDSLRHVQVCHPSAMLKLRVPSAKLDSVVNILPSVAIYVDGRNLSREDVTLRYLTNEMLNTPAGKVSKVRVNGQEALAMNRYTDEQKEKRVAREIENLDIEHRAAFSSLTVSLSQPEVVRVRVLPETEGLMTTPFYMRCYMASRTGIEIIKGVILVLLSMWPLLLIGLVIFFGLKRMKRRKLQKDFQRQA